MKNPRALARLRSDSAEFRQLKSYLHKLRVQQTGKRPRVRQIDGIVCNAGAFRFAMDNGEEITVAVSVQSPLSSVVIFSFHTGVF